MRTSPPLGPANQSARPPSSDGDLGLVGLSSPSPPTSNTNLHHPDFSPNPDTSPTLNRYSTIATDRLHSGSSSSLLSNYFSAEEDNFLNMEASGSEASPFTPLANLPVDSESFSRKHGSNVSPTHKRTPVGANGPTAPPRRASVQQQGSGRRMSNAGGSSNGHGDLASPIPGLASNTALIGSPVIANESPTISRKLGTSGALSCSPSVPVPGRNASLPASPTNSQKSSPQKRNTLASPPLLATPKPDSVSSFAKPEIGANAGLGLRNEATPSAPSLDREAMQRWVLSVGCVNFDLELGPDLEFLYPPLGISREERDNIAFSSFPDTSIFDDGSSIFSWRVREVPLDSSGSEPPTIPGLTRAGHNAGHAVDDNTPRPSMTKMKHEKQEESSSAPTSPLTGSSSRFKDALPSPSSSSSKVVSRRASDANIHSVASIHDKITAKLFSGAHAHGGAHANSSRKASHGRSDSATSMGSGTSVDEEFEEELASEQHAGVVRGGSQHELVRSGNVPTASEILAPKKGSQSTSSSYIYGYVFFRQKRDASIRRGYFQKSVVILSHLPYVSLFSEVVAKLGPLYFEYGMTMFETFANDVSNWPSPQPGSILTLPLLGSVLTAAIPFGQQAQNSPNADTGASIPIPTSRMGSISLRQRHRTIDVEPGRIISDPDAPILASIPTTSLFDTFREALPDMWLLWECILLAEPILVIGPDPKATSEAVWHMLDLIRPIPFAGDFRPYFHIHDYDFKTLVTKNKPQAGTLLGATNPFFAQVCSHWPHVLRVGKAAAKNVKFVQSGSAKRPGGVAGGNSAGGGGPDHIPGFTTKKKRRISKDRPLLKRLLEMAEQRRNNPSASEVDDGANALMRRYFADLTERFLAPLNRYVASLVPADFDLSSPSEAPKIKPFNTSAFLASLKAHGTPLPIRSRSLPTGAAVRQSLYTDFLKCPNFSLWLHARVAAAEEEQRRRYIAALLQGDVTAYGRSRGEIETIDLYSRLVEEIRLVDLQMTAPTEPGPGSRWRTDKPSPTGHVKESSSKPLHPRDLGSNGSNSGRTTPSGSGTANGSEKSLLLQKARLMDQLDKLCQTLPDDLRSSLKRPGVVEIEG
ncbi:DUF1630-domain-containing protein [Violaceomyces palustris]|uniref:DUF1630-domain-containing protein n=1 Tax=Violaceomyces palustris TaxID=1673888 RepID=A0ACD0P1C1_9BASI|nr:DUF1630-domain-containing protein [Violaceomyces palustris]